jgi:hypothetical protein
MSKPFFKKLFLNTYESVETEQDKEKHKEGSCLKDNVYYFSGEESQDEEAGGGEGDSLLIVKLQIVQSRLNLMAEAIKRSLDVVLISFLDKLQMRAEVVKLFNKDDNYLFLLPKVKLYSFKSLYAYRRLLYVIRSFRYRRTVLAGCFYKWRDIAVGKKRLDRPSAMYVFLKTIERRTIYNTHTVGIFFNIWRDSARSQINDKGVIRLYRGMLSLRKVFLMKMNKYFKILSIIGDTKDNNGLMGLFYLRQKSVLLNCNVHKYFTKWRLFSKDTKHDGFKEAKDVVNKDLEGNVFTILDRVFKNKTHLLLKRFFFEKLTGIIKTQNTLNEYGRRYLKIPYILDDNFKKGYIHLIRNVFEKLFTLKKTFFMLTNRKVKQQALTHDGSIGFNLKLCFIKWKKYVIDDIKQPLVSETKLQAFVNHITKSIQGNYIIFLRRLQGLCRNKSNLKRILETKIGLLILKVKRSTTGFLFDYFRQSSFDKLTQKKSMLKLVVYYKRFNQSKADIVSLRMWFIKWKSLAIVTPVIPVGSQSHLKDLSIYSKLTATLYKKYLRNIRPLFTVFLLKTCPRRIFIRSNNVNKIDNLVVRNQNQILVSIEKEEQKLDTENSMNRYVLSEKSKWQVVIKNIYKKHYFLLFKCFSQWRRFTLTAKDDVHILDSYDNIINESENLRIIHDNLVNMYEDKKTNYQKLLEDYEVFKKNFCTKCVQDDEFAVSYKSISHLNLNTLCDVEPAATEECDHQSSSDDSGESYEESKKCGFNS